MNEQERIADRYAHVAGALDERGRRAVAAAKALAWALSSKVLLWGKQVRRGGLRRGGAAAQAMAGLPVTARQAAKRAALVAR